jgi:hypothetical protein
MSVTMNDDVSQDLSSVGTKVLPETLEKAKAVKKPRAKKVKEVVEKVAVEGEKVDVVENVAVAVVKEKKPRTKKVKVVVDVVEKEVVEGEKVVVEVEKVVVVKEKKPRVKKEGEVKEKKPRAKKVKEVGVVVDGDAKSDSGSEGEGSEVSALSSDSKKGKGRPKKETVPKEKKEKGRPKKEKKETESNSAIDDLFANLVAKDCSVPVQVQVPIQVPIQVPVSVEDSVVVEVPVVPLDVDIVNKFVFQGTTYLKSKNTGIMYNMEQDAIGKWNENTSTIDFDEEEEEEYEDE